MASAPDPWANDPFKPSRVAEPSTPPVVEVWPRSGSFFSADTATQFDAGLTLFPSQVATRLRHDRTGAYLELTSLSKSGGGDPLISVDVSVPLTTDMMVEIANLLYTRAKQALAATSALNRVGAGRT